MTPEERTRKWVLVPVEVSGNMEIVRIISGPCETDAWLAARPPIHDEVLAQMVERARLRWLVHTGACPHVCEDGGNHCACSVAIADALRAALGISDE